jgi:hypothetical protein
LNRTTLASSAHYLTAADVSLSPLQLQQQQQQQQHGAAAAVIENRFALESFVIFIFEKINGYAYSCKVSAFLRSFNYRSLSDLRQR